jgi:hypothetical protein
MFKNKRAHDDLLLWKIKVSPGVWTAPLLTSGLFVLAALFVRAAVVATALAALAGLAHVALMILAALLTAG